MKFSRSATKALAASTLLLTLAGCAFSPGPLFGPALQGQGANTASETTGQAAPPSTLVRLFQGKSSSIVTGTSAPNAPADPNLPDAPPPGVLRPITPDLIQSIQRDARQANTLAALQPLFGKAGAYTIGVGDVVHINVWGHPELVLPPAGSTTSGTEASSQSGVTNGFNVSPDGLIQFPLIGTLKIAGLTENQARLELAKALKRYIVDPQITLRVQAYRAGRVYMDGEVRTPGLQAINDVPMTLPEALSRAGGLTATADRSQVFITREGVTTPINLLSLSQRGINPAQILLKNNDLVRVAHRDDAKVYVMGEVVRQAALPLRNGRLSLNEALGESGGINPTSGDPKQIFVIRSRSTQPAESAAGQLPEIFHLDARSPMGYALAEGFELQARDVVYVDPVPLVRWNRVISLILPSAQAVNVTRDALN
ncbi:MAG: polysaccharide biosynthesis/export family protein [Hydrogenophaga sp.]|uniref:polysaccharide biosynthesis/export family protein n=1 Tax=Hydrogenophaga sp. TaxID=1904254 RepID=UPI00276E40AF|nr:polysaccharide biosynthesis/export family protein [Hydrogenophaga sp.]MDP2416289.1 polysaccharide biosynthesis/export family protein [Hydrogenophaga sp.]MDZ4189028.1 polysaccharide biosynthesis/export family protein [Hydrogenophaga sp.]